MMTEHEWNTCVNPLPMLEFLRGKASPRKLRLFSCACCRDVWHLFRDKRQQWAVQVAEEFAEGLVNIGDLIWAHEKTQFNIDLNIPASLAPFLVSAPPRYCLVKTGWATAMACAGGESFQSYSWHDSFAVWHLAHHETSSLAQHEVNNPPDQAENWEQLVQAFLEHFEFQEPVIKERFQKQTEILRDIFGNPFLSTEKKRDWKTWNEGLIIELAQEIYEARRFEDLPVLGDALEDVGCREETILEHCRSNKPHVRGCWVIDLLLDWDKDLVLRKS